MGPKIIFLGNLGSEAIIENGSSAGIIINIEDKQFHIDPGPGALIKLNQYNIELNNPVILVSHKHIGHCNDLNLLIEKTKSPENKTIVITNDDVINNIITEYHKSLAKLIDIEKEKTIKIGNIEIKKIKAFHSVKTTGFKFFAPEFTLAYSSDTRFDNKLIEEYKNTDILILNVTSKLKQENNLSISDAEKIIKKVKPKLTIITYWTLQ